MRAAKGSFRQASLFWTVLVLAVLLVITLTPNLFFAQDDHAAADNSRVSIVPAGTILPIVLRTSLTFAKCKPGQAFEGEIAQDVPLPNGGRIRKGSPVEGNVTDAKPSSSHTTVTIQFHRPKLDSQWVSVVTDLRALAGAMVVQEAAVPLETPGEGSTYVWLPTMQIGGDTVYGLRGPVTSVHDASKVIGKSVPGGVLVQVSAKEGAGCRGAMGDNRPQALWVFSSDACGVYGIERLKIVHAGRTSPKGMIALPSDDQRLKIRAGAGLLLRVE